MNQFLKIGAIAAFCLFAFPAAAQSPVDGFIARVYKGPGPLRTMPYRLFIPKDYNKDKKYPLILWLHGAGGTGSDNLLQISGDQVLGTHLWTRPENQAKHPAFVLVPQSPGDGRWDNLSGDQLSAPITAVLGILDSLKAEFSIDPQRLYVAGQSNGGIGTWDLISKRPNLFAAAIALCGVGDPARAAGLVKMPIWAFHGEIDDVISVNYTRAMIAAIRKAGGHPIYTEYKGVGHDVWTPAFSEPGLVEWLFAQHK